jgi:hypothetical protein
MSSITRDEIVEAFDALHDAVSGLLELSFEVLTTPERLALLERLEQELRRLPTAPGSPSSRGVKRRARLKRDTWRPAPGARAAYRG